MTDWISNGKSISSISINDRGLHYGDGLFETIAVRDGVPRLWAYHIERLRLGCKTLGIEAPGETNLRSDLDVALQKSSLSQDDCLAKIVVTAGVGQRGYGRKSGVKPSVFIGVFPAALLPTDLYRDGVDTMLCSTRLSASPALAGLKTLNRLDQVLARSEVMTKGVFEGLTMDADSKVICGTMSNVFFVNNETISTSSLELCGVKGVMRRHIIATLQDNGVAVADQAPGTDDLADCDEIFISNSQFGVLPVKRCDELRWRVGRTTRNVMALLTDNGVTECTK